MIKILFPVLFLAGCTTTSSDLGYKGLSNDDGVNVLKTLEKLKLSPGSSVRLVSGWTVVNQESKRALWSFPPETHPAFPSYAKRTPVEKDGSVYLSTEVVCEATKIVCDSFVRDFIELNQKVKQGMNQN